MHCLTSLEGDDDEELGNSSKSSPHHLQAKQRKIYSASNAHSVNTDYMMSQNRRPQSKSLLPRNPEISYSYPYIFAICYPD
jgi:hypothetical protein